ncbi:hypothetical protein [Reyranella sp.]|uniref:hypothetical protein n=1 Tax=Reyranella sp. TaxID=1929291 RepID=UPI003D0B9EE0
MAKPGYLLLICFAGDARDAAAGFKSCTDAGVAHMCLRLADEPEPQKEALARMRQELGR